MITKAYSRHPAFKTHSFQQNYEQFKLTIITQKMKTQTVVLTISMQTWLFREKLNNY